VRHQHAKDVAGVILWLLGETAALCCGLFRRPFGVPGDVLAFVLTVPSAMNNQLRTGADPVQKKVVGKEVKKATLAKKAVLRGTNGLKVKQVRTNTHFFRPKTLKLDRAPKYPRRSVPRTPRLDAFRIIDMPLNTESAMKQIEDHNTLVFICHVTANKKQIKDACKRLYDINAVKINTMIRPDGKKKAYVKLGADTEAMEIANKIGFI
jgi:large subunit ribosomal protein L23Ae